MRRNFANKRKYQNADPIGAESIAISAGQAAAGAVQDIPIADVNIDPPQLNITDSYTPTFEDLSFSAQQDPYMRQYYGITEGTTYNSPSGMQPAGAPKASTIDDAPVNMRQRILNRRSNRLDEKIANASAGEESVVDKARGALESLGIYNVSDTGKYMQAFTDSPERAFTRAGYNMELGPRGKARAAGNIAEASTSLLGSFLQGFGSYKKPEVMTEEKYLAAKKAEQAKKNNTVMIGDTRYTLVEDSEGRMTIGPEYQETQTAQEGKVIGMQDFLNPTMFNPFAMQGQPANPVNPQSATGNNNQLLTGVQPVTGIQPSISISSEFDLDGDGIPDFVDIDGGTGTNQSLTGLGGVTAGPAMSPLTDFSSTVDTTTDSDGDGIPDYQDDFDNSTVSEEERQKDINKAQASLFGTAASLGSSVGMNDLGVQAARAGMMGKRILEGDNPLASTVGLAAGLGSVGFGAARTMKGARSEAIASADATKRAAERLRQGIMTGGTKGRDASSLEAYLQSSTYDPMATESGQEGLMIGYSNGGATEGEQTPPLPKGAVVGPLTARYFNRTAPVSSKGLVDFPNGPVMVPSNQLTMVEAEAGGELPDLVAAYPDGDPSIVMEKGKRYSFPNSTQVLEIPLNQALYG